MMRPLQLDFSNHGQQRRQRIALVIAALMLLLLGLLVTRQHQMEARINELKAQQGIATVAPRHQPDVEEQRSFQTAKNALRALNMPWEQFLSTLEATQRNHNNIQLLSLQPNLAKGEVSITGVATDFAAMMAYLQALKEQPMFADVTLLNQRSFEANDLHGLEFTLTVEWRA